MRESTISKLVKILGLKSTHLWFVVGIAVTFLLNVAITLKLVNESMMHYKLDMIWYFVKRHKGLRRRFLNNFAMSDRFYLISYRNYIKVGNYIS